MLVSTQLAAVTPPPVYLLSHKVETPNAGCSIADELFTSFEQLLTLADRKGVKYDRYVVVCMVIKA